MDREELKWMIDELNDKATVIRGYAQLALECEHPGRSKKYIKAIIRQIDRLSALNTVIETLYLCADDDSHDCGSKPAAPGDLVSHGKYH